MKPVSVAAPIIKLKYCTWVMGDQSWKTCKVCHLHGQIQPRDSSTVGTTTHSVSRWAHPPTYLQRCLLGCKTRAIQGQGAEPSLATMGRGNPNGDTICNPGLMTSVLSPTLFWVYDQVFQLYAWKISRFKQEEDP